MLRLMLKLGLFLWNKIVKGIAPCGSETMQKPHVLMKLGNDVLTLLTDRILGLYVI